MFGRVAAGALCTALVCATSHAQTGAAWRHQAFREINYFLVTSAGSLVVVTDSSAVALDPTDGHTLWERRGGMGYVGLGLSPFGMLGTPKHWEVIDLESGRTRWTQENLPLREPRRHLALPQRNLMLVEGSSDAGPLTLVAVSLDSGVVRWRLDTLLSHVPKLADRVKDLSLAQAQPVLLDTDSTAVMFPRRGGVVRIHIGTGALLWRADTLVNQAPLNARWGYASMVADSSLVLVPYDRRLLALSREDGSVRWDHRDKFPSQLAEIVPTEHGILVRGFYKDDKPSDSIEGFLDLLDRFTGRSLWPRPMKDIRNPSALLVRGDTAYFASKDRFFVLDLPSARLREVANLKFEGGESPWGIEERGGGLVLLSSQNLMCLETSGAGRFHKYYPAPGTSLFDKIMSTAVLVGLNVAIGAGAQSVANSTGAPIVYPQFADNPVLWRRYKATLEAERYTHMLTSAAAADGRKGFSVVRLEKETGQEAGRVWVDDRSPDYVVDAASGTLFLLRRGKRVIEALRFDASPS
jgi:outer membrane protein assembly factor BamB